MKTINVGLVEIGDSFGGQYYFPYSLGVLLAYAKKKLARPDEFVFSVPVYQRNDLDRSVSRLSGMDIVFFSAYLWNFKASLEIARCLKAVNMNIITVFGGPQVPESHERMTSFLSAYPFIDVASYGVGEVAFLRILEHCAARTWDGVPSLGFRRGDGTVILTPATECVTDINDIPSPYLDGIFDELMRENPAQRWSGLLETNRGCPFTCAYCYWGKKTERRVSEFALERVYQEIDWFSSKGVEFVFCCDANFGIFNRDLDISTKVAQNKRQYGFPQAFSVQNTKNAKERIFELQKILNDSGLQKGVNLALQSLNKKTLQYIERSNIDNKTYTDLQRLFTRNNIQTFTDLIIALPGESYESFTDGVSEIIQNGQHNRIQFINLTILENTLMAKPEFQQEHDFQIVEAAFVPHHASPAAPGEITETQFLVVGTNTMPGDDWIRTRVFGWMASLLHFDKLLQIPFIILHEVGGISYKHLIEALTDKPAPGSILAEIVDAFRNKAVEIRNGGSEYSYSKKWLNITWYPDELTIIGLCTENRLRTFYREAGARLLDLAEGIGGIAPDLVRQAVQLNYDILKQPFIKEDTVFASDYNIWEVYQAALKGDKKAIIKGTYTYRIDRTSRQWDAWDDWCREVIWYGNKKGDYIYSLKE